jgi:type IV fimbrial biogenesis protein FimT
MGGVTLPELLITVSMIAITGTMAIPSFMRLQHSMARTAAVNDFFHALFLARSESIKRAGVVSVCPSPNGSQCDYSTPSWAAGWIVFVNHDHDDKPIVDTGDEIIEVSSGWRGGAITSNRAAYSFRPYAQGVVNGTILFCDPTQQTDPRAIIISHTGRPRVSTTDASNKPLNCGVPAG